MLRSLMWLVSKSQRNTNIRAKVYNKQSQTVFYNKAAGTEENKETTTIRLMVLNKNIIVILQLYYLWLNGKINWIARHCGHQKGNYLKYFNGTKVRFIWTTENMIKLGHHSCMAHGAQCKKGWNKRLLQINILVPFGFAFS